MVVQKSSKKINFSKYSYTWSTKFFPDFIVGINGRTRGEGILLVEIKNVINDEKKNAQVKSEAIHPDYQKVLMLYWEKSKDG